MWIQTFKTNLSAQVNSLPADKLQEIQKAIELFSVGQGPAKTMEEATRRSYQFWDTQPVPKLGVMSAVLSLLLQNKNGKRSQQCLCFMNEVSFSFRGDGNVTWLYWTWQRQHTWGALQPPAGLLLGHSGLGEPGCGKCCIHTPAAGTPWKIPSLYK